MDGAVASDEGVGAGLSIGSDAASAAQSRRGGRVAGARRVLDVVVDALAVEVPRDALVLLAVLAGVLAAVLAAAVLVLRVAGVAAVALPRAAAPLSAVVAPAAFAFRVSLRGFPKNLTNAHSLCVLQYAASCSDLLRQIHECPCLRALRLRYHDWHTLIPALACLRVQRQLAQEL